MNSHKNLEPNRIWAGDTVRWFRVVPFYSQLDGWTLKYRFTSALSVFDVVETPRECADGHYITISSEESAAFVAGEYTWVAFVVNGSGERHTVAQGACTVLANVAAGTEPTDLRTQAQRSLDAINAVLEGRAGADIEEYEIHGRRVKKMDVDELLRLRGFFATQVQQERAARGERVGPRKVRTVFGGIR